MKNKLITYILILTLCITAVFCLSSCSGSSDSSGGAETEESTADTSGDASAAQQDAWADVGEIDISTLGGAGGVDVDLTTLSSTMVYAVVNDMMNNPNNYMDKKIRMKGNMSTYEDPESGDKYFACLIQDATACCAQGIEFITTSDYKYPEDYPEENSEFTVVGTLGTIVDKGAEYYVLKDAVFEA